jgi:6-phosphogluconate dehydrogenase (decarboxylating)
MKIGFIGLGRMGSAMATNLLKAGHQLTVFNRSPEKLRPLTELGAGRPALLLTPVTGASLLRCSRTTLLSLMLHSHMGALSPSS